MAVCQLNRLDQDPAHLLVVDLAALQTRLQVQADQLAVGAGHPVRDVGVLVDDVQPDRKPIARQQAGVAVGAARARPHLLRPEVGEGLQPDRLGRLRDVDVAAADLREAERAGAERAEVDPLLVRLARQRDVPLAQPAVLADNPRLGRLARLHQHRQQQRVGVPQLVQQRRGRGQVAPAVHGVEVVRLAIGPQPAEDALQQHPLGKLPQPAPLDHPRDQHRRRPRLRRGEQPAIQERHPRQRLKQPAADPLVGTGGHPRVNLDLRLGQELLLQRPPPLRVGRVLVQEQVDVGLGERRVAGVAPHEIHQRAVEHQHPQIGRAVQRRQPAEQLGGDADDVDEVLAPLAAALQIAEEDRVVAEVLALGQPPLAGADAVRPDPQQQRHLAADPHLPHAAVDERDDLVPQVRPPQPVGRRAGEDRPRAAGPHPPPQGRDELGRVLEVVVAQPVRDRQRVLQEAKVQVRLRLQRRRHLTLTAGGVLAHAPPSACGRRGPARSQSRRAVNFPPCPPAATASGAGQSSAGPSACR